MMVLYQQGGGGQALIASARVPSPWHSHTLKTLALFLHDVSQLWHFAVNGHSLAIGSQAVPA